ncbi:hypothetical protein IP65_16515 [Novosphingobium sp. AAP1]|uniref:hypothetical protein n=1 Tax=Novosphingobium sp. AAP1 TaxID=1523413 RepID=UPI0006B8AA3D|nr:hypothetical protein [Novosphingobium sp. AAP1]KPF52365.1 hypothetical protein IP65_16515 [Novosphingobium sp. AAP1]
MAADDRKATRLGILLVAIVFIAVAVISDLEKALAASVTFGVFMAIIQAKWESRNDWRFWAVIAIFAVIHIVAISVIRFPEVRAGLVSLPFALVDGFIMWGLINWIERRFPRPGSRSEP